MKLFVGLIISSDKRPFSTNNQGGILSILTGNETTLFQKQNTSIINV